MNPDANKLRDEVFGCDCCADLGAFTKSPDNGRFYKFPPIIGASGAAELLFIGINPRRSKTNPELHDWLMESPINFAMLAHNQVPADESYIAIDGKEEHYHCHMMVIEGVFGTGTKLEEVAALTELYLCANEGGSRLLDAGRSVCAERYLKQVVSIVKPRVVIAVGSGVRRHLINHFGDIVPIPPVAMEHPALLFGKGRETKLRAMQPTIDKVRTVLGDARCRI